VETGERRLLLHALIQLAAAFVKLCARNPRGTVQLLDKARRKLAALPAALDGVDVAAVRALADHWHAAAAALVAAGRTDFDPAALPHLPRTRGSQGA
jgi:predicted metal-dependent hydrolase